MSTIQTQVNLFHAQSSLGISGSITRTSVESGFSADAITVTTTPEAIALGDVISLREVTVKLLSGDDLLVSIDGGGVYPISLSGSGSSMLLPLESREAGVITCVADSSRSLSGLYFDIEDFNGPVRVWFDTVPVFASGTLTLSGNAFVDETVVLGGVTYTFKTTLTTALNQVLIGGSASASIDNLIAAITEGAGSGTLYSTGTIANSSVTAAVGAGDTMIATAIAAGTAGNTIVSTETLSSGSWGATTLAGGLESTAPTTPTNGRLLPVSMVEDATASTNATDIAATIDADAEFHCTAATNTLTITDAKPGIRTDIDGGTSTFTGVASTGTTTFPSVYFKSLGSSDIVVVVAPN